MPLAEVELELRKNPLPQVISRLLDDAKRQIDALSDKMRADIPAFVPCDFELVYHALDEINAGQIATGRRFIEWGSGIGVVACLAASLGFDAVGIEIEQPLVDIANRLARAHRVNTQFACGSFVPDGIEPSLDWAADVAWLTTDAPDAYDELELEPDDFDLVFSYPWPGEEQVIFDLFTECAAVGALLLTYQGINELRLQRKVKR
jgi:hypothetical protein